jgi:hypothetical protein
MNEPFAGSRRRSGKSVYTRKLYSDRHLTMEELHALDSEQGMKKKAPNLSGLLDFCVLDAS